MSFEQYVPVQPFPVEVYWPGHKALKSHMSPMVQCCGEVELILKEVLPFR